MKSNVTCAICNNFTSAYEPHYCENCKRPVVVEKAIFEFKHLTNFLESNGRKGATKRLKKYLGIKENHFNKGNYIDLTVEALSPKEIRRIDFHSEKEKNEFYDFEKDLEILRNEFDLNEYDNHIILALR